METIANSLIEKSNLLEKLTQDHAAELVAVSAGRDKALTELQAEHEVAMTAKMVELSVENAKLTDSLQTSLSEAKVLGI